MLDLWQWSQRIIYLSDKLQGIMTYYQAIIHFESLSVCETLFQLISRWAHESVLLYSTMHCLEYHLQPYMVPPIRNAQFRCKWPHVHVHPYVLSTHIDYYIIVLFTKFLVHCRWFSGHAVPRCICSFKWVKKCGTLISMEICILKRPSMDFSMSYLLNGRSLKPTTMSILFCFQEHFMMLSL